MYLYFMSTRSKFNTCIGIDTWNYTCICISVGLEEIGFFFSPCSTNRAWCDSWSWCLVQTPLITSARPPSPSWQLCRSHSSSWIYRSPGGRVTATWAPIVTCRCIFFSQDLDIQRLPCLFFLFFLFISSILSVARSQTFKKGETGRSRAAAAVFREAARWAVVQSAEKRPIPLWWHGVDHCSSGWGCTSSASYLLTGFRFRD